MQTGEAMPQILVVDDLHENIAILDNFLTPRGFKVASAYNGHEALESVQASPPDVVLLDLMMPEVDGFEVCRCLKQSAETHHIPVIIITGIPEREANIRAVEAGADDFILKPFDSVLLEARIRSSLKTKRLHDELVASQQRLAATNQTLEACVLERTAQLERTQQVAIFSLAKLAESRDNETGAHLDRMRVYVREVAEELRTKPVYEAQMPDGYIETLFMSCPLHDIGKVGIPDNILLKPGKLTAEEFEIMKQHSAIGGETLRVADLESGQNSFLAMGRDIAYYHHERWDGKGYPFGLAGNDIPLCARIVALCDVYDALSSKRPYKEPFSHEKSRSIILEGAGTQFDADVVEAFLAREGNFVEIRDNFSDEATNFDSPDLPLKVKIA